MIKPSYTTEYVLSEPNIDERVLNDPRVQAQMRAIVRLVSLRMSAQIWGASEAWVQSQLSESDRIILAKTADPIERAMLPAPKDAN